MNSQSFVADVFGFSCPFDVSKISEDFLRKSLKNDDVEGVQKRRYEISWNRKEKFIKLKDDSSLICSETYIIQGFL